MQSSLAEIAHRMVDDGATTHGSGLDLQARGALLLLIRAAGQVHNTPKPNRVHPSSCPNCYSPAAAARSPYCSDECRCEAAFVRQTRAAIDTGAILDKDRQIALGENFWKLLGGGYPRRQGMVLPKTLKKVFQRANGRCEVCGAPAITVDHIGSG